MGLAASEFKFLLCPFSKSVVFRAVSLTLEKKGHWRTLQHPDTELEGVSGGVILVWHDSSSRQVHPNKINTQCWAKKKKERVHCSFFASFPGLRISIFRTHFQQTGPAGRNLCLDFFFTAAWIDVHFAFCDKKKIRENAKGAPLH